MEKTEAKKSYATVPLSLGFSLEHMNEPADVISQGTTFYKPKNIIKRSSQEREQKLIIIRHD
jgi:hypothetical protein